MDHDQDHLVYIGEEHFCIRHSLECFDKYKKEKEGMTLCPFHIELRALPSPPIEPGDYAIEFFDGLLEFIPLG